MEILEPVFSREYYADTSTPLSLVIFNATFNTTGS